MRRMMNEVEFYLKDLESKFEKINPEEYYLSYSGGKDSHFLYWFIKEYLRETKIKIISVNTYMEHQEISARMLKYADEILLPRLKPFEIKERYGIPCFSKIQDGLIDRYQRGVRTKGTMRYVLREEKSRFNLNKKASDLTLNNKLHKISDKCCYYLKKEPLNRYAKESGRKPIMGVRGAEGVLRKYNYEGCFSKNGKFTPIYDLTNSLLDRIYRIHHIETPNIYAHVERTGCIACPYGSTCGDVEKELKLIAKNRFDFITEYFKESYHVRGIKVD